MDGSSATSILGIGTAVPEHTMSLDEAVAMSTALICRTEREARLMRTMHTKARVQSRRTCVPHRTAFQWIDEGAPPGSSAGPTTQERMALYAEHARPLAVSASARALDGAAIAAGQITHLVTVSCTGFDAPGTDIHLFDQLGLPATTQRLHIGFMGCHGVINALRAAQGLASADPTAHILICAVELCSLHFQFRWDPERMLGNALFADGAAALVVAPSRSKDGGLYQLCDTGSCLLKNSRDAITWRIGDAGFEMTLSNRVPRLIAEQLHPWLAAWLHTRGQTIDTVRSWAVHPGGPKIVEAVDEALGFGSETLSTSRSVLRDYGNMSSPTLLFILERLLSQNASRPIVLLGFGPGLIAEVALLM